MSLAKLLLELRSPGKPSLYKFNFPSLIPTWTLNQAYLKTASAEALIPLEHADAHELSSSWFTLIGPAISVARF